MSIHHGRRSPHALFRRTVGDAPWRWDNPHAQYKREIEIDPFNRHCKKNRFG
jgi:hypothetical protein